MNEWLHQEVPLHCIELDYQLSYGSINFEHENFKPICLPWREYIALG